MNTKISNQHKAIIMNPEEISNNPNLTKSYGLWIKQSLKDLDKDFINAESEPKDISSPPKRRTQDSRRGVTCIPRLYLPLLKFLRILGFFPYTFGHDEEGAFVVKPFKLGTLLAVFSLCVSTLFTITVNWMFVYLLCHSFNENEQEVRIFGTIALRKSELPKNISRVAEFATRLIPATFPLFGTVAAYGTLSSLTDLRRLLNKWSFFQKEFMSAFGLNNEGEDPFGNLRRFRNAMCTIFSLIGFLATSFVVVVIGDCGAWQGCIFPGGCITSSVAAFTMLIMIAGHGIHFLLFRSLTESFIQIRMEIRRNSSQDLQVLHKNVKKWTRIILRTKELVGLTGKTCSAHHSLTIFINFIYLCLGVFTFASSKMEFSEGNRGPILLIFSAWGFGLLTVKAFMCEKITAQEKKIVFELRQLETKDYVPVLIQIKSLIDIMVQEPAEIRFWNVVTFNKSFLLQLIGQVATYLIVLIQFDNKG